MALHDATSVLLKHSLYTLLLIARKAPSLLHFPWLHWGEGDKGGTCPPWYNFISTLRVEVNISTNRQRISTVWKNIRLQQNISPHFSECHFHPLPRRTISKLRPVIFLIDTLYLSDCMCVGVYMYLPFFWVSSLYFFLLSLSLSLCSKAWTVFVCGSSLL